MRILVTGGAGFLGSNLCARLARRGEEVCCLDNLSTGRLENLRALLKLPNFRFIEGDVTEALDLQVDQIYNAACPASPPAYQRDPIHTLKTSVLGALNLLELARGCGATLLQFSTSEVYGDAQQHPQREDYWGNVNPIGPRSCYDEGKRAAEALCFDYRRVHGVKVRLARIFNTYGPGMRPDDGRVVSSFVWRALRGEELAVYGDGNQTRSFCYVDDLIEGIVRLMNAPEEVTGPVNLGNPEEFTMNELARLVLERTGSASRIVRRPLPGDDPKRRRPDVRLAKELLGWAPVTKLEDGLDRLIEDYRERLNRISAKESEGI